MPLPKQHTYTSEDYWNLPDSQRAELIDGQLYNMAPPSRMHQRLVMELSATIRDYIRSHHGSCQVYPAPFAVNLDADDKDSGWNRIYPLSATTASSQIGVAPERRTGSSKLYRRPAPEWTITKK